MLGDALVSARNAAPGIGRALARACARLVLVAAVGLNASHGDELAVPTGQIILRVTGAIAKHNDGEAAVFDRAQLQALGSATLQVETPWTDGQVVFEGPLVRTLLERVGASGKQVTAVALNDYRVQIPVSDFETYDVVLALTRDGKPMRVREKGPIWIIYPWGTRPELRNEIYHGRSIWQLNALHVE